MPFFKKLTLYEKAQLAKRRHEKEVAKTKDIRRKELIERITERLTNYGFYRESQYISFMDVHYDSLKEHFEELGFNVEYVNGYLCVGLKDE